MNALLAAARARPRVFGSYVDQVDKRGRTALHQAARGGHAAVVSALLAAGADAEQQDYAGATALEMAIQKDKEECVRVLCNVRRLRLL